jgi:hypothetical protein
MRSQQLIPALALAAALAVPAALAAAPPAGATTAAASCLVELGYVDLNNVDELDGTDEVRIDLGGLLYPGTGSAVRMRSGDRALSASFGNPSTTITPTGSAVYSVREVTPPFPGGGTDLGATTASGALCAALAPGQVVSWATTITGIDETFYSYSVRLMMTGL